MKDRNIKLSDPRVPDLESSEQAQLRVESEKASAALNRSIPTEENRRIQEEENAVFINEFIKFEFWTQLVKRLIDGDKAARAEIEEKLEKIFKEAKKKWNENFARF